MIRAKAFITASRWQFAKTMPQFPHEYTVRAWAEKAGTVPEFEHFVMFIRETGTPREWHGRRFIYLEIDGWKYWTMGNPLSETTVINRETCPPKPSQPGPA